MEQIEEELYKMNIEEKYSLIENTREGTQLRILAEIFEENNGKELSKREIEKIFGFKVSCSHIDFKTIDNLEDLITNSKKLPGDLQRDLRTFYTKFEKYGLKKTEKKDSEDNTLKYIWNPVNKFEDFVKKCPRDLFKNKKDRFEFCESKENKCELCEKSCDRMAIDHWRAHSVYNIDNIDIAVLLCEQCNNIHHNHDAVKVAKKYHNNIGIIENWVKIESRMQKSKCMPNEEDKKEQLETIKYITGKLTEKSIIPDDNLWKGLNK